MRLDFIYSNRRLCKAISQGFTEPYPQVKNVSSLSENIADLNQLLEILKKHSRKGHALLKGPLLRQLNNESRANQTDRAARAQWVVLDFDKIEIQLAGMPESAEGKLNTVAEHIIQWLPEEFRRTSYIVQASNSFGLKRDTYSFHVFFMLADSVDPFWLKNYLTHLNLETPQLRDRCKLSASGSALCYPLDVSCADNTKLIYIAPPQFHDVEDPFQDPDSRFQIVHKQDLALRILDLGANAINLKRQQQRLIRELRISADLPDKKPQIQSVNINGKYHDVEVNPDAVNMVYVRDNDNFVYYNINGGDSNAYYVLKSKPTIVFNFKGEPNFIFEKADPATYRWHIENYCNAQQLTNLPEDERLQPFIFRDFDTDQHYNGLYDPVTSRIVTIAQAQKANLAAFMTQHGAVMPDVNEIETWRYVFDPSNPVQLDFNQRIANKWVEPTIAAEIPDIPEQFKGATIGQAKQLYLLCPTIYKVLWSVTGCDDQCYGLFLNWLAYVLRTRSKTGIAWIFHGCPGTGKGVLFHDIITPLFGPAYSGMYRLENLEDTFTAWLETNIVCCIDEFRVKDSPQFLRLINKLKNLITEPRGAVRAMRVDSRIVPLYNNFILFSNEHDIMPLDEGDRRFNVAPRQEIPIVHRHPTFREDVQLIADELPQFAAFLRHWQIDRTSVSAPLMNAAKQKLIHDSENSVDEFCRALNEGNLDYFIQVLEMPLTLINADTLNVAQRIVRRWISTAVAEEYAPTRLDELQCIYNVLMDSIRSPVKFGKLLSHKGIKSTMLKINGTSSRGLKLKFAPQEFDLQTLVTQFSVVDPREEYH